jgi:hypothetical protein
MVAASVANAARGFVFPHTSQRFTPSRRFLPVQAARDLRIGIGRADNQRVAPTRVMEGSLTISTADRGYVATFVPYAEAHWPIGKGHALPSLKAVARFLQEIIGTPTGQRIHIIDDLRHIGGAFIPRVTVNAEQRRRLQL